MVPVTLPILFVTCFIIIYLSIFSYNKVKNVHRVHTSLVLSNSDFCRGYQHHLEENACCCCCCLLLSNQMSCCFSYQRCVNTPYFRSPLILNGGTIAHTAHTHHRLKLLELNESSKKTLLKVHSLIPYIVGDTSIYFQTYLPASNCLVDFKRWPSPMINDGKLHFYSRHWSLLMRYENTTD